MKKNKKFEIIAIILIILFAISISPKTLQNDTFYTIKIGELIVKNKNIDALINNLGKIPILGINLNPYIIHLQFL